MTPENTMIGKIARIAIVVALIVPLAWMLSVKRVSGQTSVMPSTANGEWPMYTADLRGSKYSPLDQINAGNFNSLQVAWTFKTTNLGPTPEAKLEGTPIMVKDVIYTTG